MSEFKAEICLPKRLAEDVQDQVKAGWFPDLNCLAVEAERHVLTEVERSVMKDAICDLVPREPLVVSPTTLPKSILVRDAVRQGPIVSGAAASLAAARSSVRAARSALSRSREPGT